MAKFILHGIESRKLLKSGIDKLANTVKSTIGPKGRNVIIEKTIGSPLITNDGVTIAKEIELEDKIENMGAQLVKEVAIKTNDIAGDGTTTATVLTQAIMQEGLDAIDVLEHNPVLLRKGIDKACNKAVSILKEMSKPIKTHTEIEQIATISSGDEEIGKLIANAIDAVGKDGSVTIEEGKTLDTIFETVKGFKFDKGMISSHMIKNEQKSETILNNPYILITDKKINQIAEIFQILELAISENRPLFIIAEDISEEVVTTLVVNTQRNILDTVVVKCPEFGIRRKQVLEDIAIMTNANVISSDIGLELVDTKVSDLGQAESVKINKNSTLIVNGKGELSKIKNRIEKLRQELNDENISDYDKEKIQERLAKLTGGVAVIKVGAATEVEMKEKKLRIEDALNATKAAIEEGIVAGGGTALHSIVPFLEEYIENSLKDDEKVGAKIISNALIAPLMQIAINAGYEPANVIVNCALKRKELNNNNIGYNALSGTYVDMIQSGIIDPVKVTRSALQNAASISSVFLTTEAAIITI